MIDSSGGVGDNNEQRGQQGTDLQSHLLRLDVFCLIAMQMVMMMMRLRGRMKRMNRTSTRGQQRYSPPGHLLSLLMS